jgi:hypothetical protein
MTRTKKVAWFVFTNPKSASVSRCFPLQSRPLLLRESPDRLRRENRELKNELGGNPEASVRPLDGDVRETIHEFLESGLVYHRLSQ